MRKVIKIQSKFCLDPKWEFNRNYVVEPIQLFILSKTVIYPSIYVKLMEFTELIEDDDYYAVNSKLMQHVLCRRSKDNPVRRLVVTLGYFNPPIWG